MKKLRYLFVAAMILVISITWRPFMEVQAATNTKDDLFYVGQQYSYQFARIGTIKKVRCSNNKIVLLDIGEESLDINTKSAGKAKITVIGSNYTYTINLTVKKVAVTAKFCKQLPDGNYLVQIVNHTREGFFNMLNFTVVFRSSNGEFLDWDENYETGVELIPGASIYEVYKPIDDINFDLSKSTLEVSDFTTDREDGYHYIDCTSKIEVINSNKETIDSSSTNITFKLKNKASYNVDGFAQIYWCNKTKEIVKIDNVNYTLARKKTKKITIRIPEEKYGAVSYSISIYAYHKEI